MNRKNGNKWYYDPRRKCAGDWRFTNLPQGSSAKVIIAELQMLCFTCPVIKACKEDAERFPTSGVVQGGEVYR